MYNVVPDKATADHQDHRRYSRAPELEDLIADDEIEKYKVVRIADEVVVDILKDACGVDYACAAAGGIEIRTVEGVPSSLPHSHRRSDDAIAYATVRAKLERAGTPIGPLDTLKASQAVARKLAPVSNQERQLRRVSGLTAEYGSR
jgi:hypothetical protein